MRPQNQREPNPFGIGGKPRALQTTTTAGLLFGDHNRSFRRAAPRFFLGDSVRGGRGLAINNMAAERFGGKNAVDFKFRQKVGRMQQPVPFARARLEHVTAFFKDLDMFPNGGS